ncbi:zinc finger and BTB domain-containing protein 16-A [Trichomycterus rosablanca]|uniref:zinc finger and BTB domain-containing protein 16-A n=1 Tax=Trichomycterus rosablanca TaxID=2290929 RepID=UPI002F35B3A7
MIRIQNPHPLPFLHQTETFLREGTLCDTILKVEDHIFKVHALVLSWASKSLERQLTNQSSSKSYCCIVDGVPPHTVRQILDYVYSAWVEVPKGDLPDLLRGAQHLEVHSLIEQCLVQLKIQEELKHANKRFSPEIDTGHRDSSKKIPSSDEASLSSSSESPPVTHFVYERLKHVTSQPPSPQKPPLSVAVASPTSSRESVSTTDSCLTPSLPQLSSIRWPPLNPSRRMLLSYSDLIAIQHMMACSYPAPLYPFFQHSVQLHMPSSIVGYSGLLHPHQHPLRPRPLTLDSPLIPDLKDKNDSISDVLPGVVTQDRERKQKVQSERETSCRNCRKPIVDISWRPSVRSGFSGSELMLCKFCQKSSREKRSLRSLQRGLKGEKPYQCKHCNKRFSLKHQLDTHLRVHTGEKPFECRLCGQRSRDYSAMIKHLRTHSGATPYQCTLCLEFCSSLATMQKHLKGHPSQDFPPNWSLSSTYLYTCHT